eukprot:6474529-Amphidinium_carterae.2
MLKAYSRIGPWSAEVAFHWEHDRKWRAWWQAFTFRKAQELSLGSIAHMHVSRSRLAGGAVCSGPKQRASR